MLSILPLILLSLSFLNPMADAITYIPVTVTAYEPKTEQTDDTPLITASNERVRLGIIALSKDLEKEYNFHFGDTIWLEKYGLFVFEDRMHPRWKRRVDIFMWSGADIFGIKKDKIILIR